MNDWEYTTFRPKWARNAEDREFLSKMPDVGHFPEPMPSFVTRIVPAAGGSRISASTLSDAILLKQRIINYAAYEVVRGVEPSFSDLRKIDDECLQLGRLEFEPFEEGSFVIPAELRADSISIQVDGKARMISTVDVLERFNEVILQLPRRGIDLNVSMGFIYEINALHKLLRRDVGLLEFSTVLPSGSEQEKRRQTTRHTIDSDYLARVYSIRRARESMLVRADDTLVGTLVAVDFENRKLKIRLDSAAQTIVQGKFLPDLNDDLVSNLMKKAQFIGRVTYQHHVPTHFDLVKLVPMPNK